MNAAERYGELTILLLDKEPQGSLTPAQEG